MHFRLPKRLHGWREFASEVRIIALGVLIALGSELMVETIKWKSHVADAKDDLGAEFEKSVRGS